MSNTFIDDSVVNELMNGIVINACEDIMKAVKQLSKKGDMSSECEINYDSAKRFLKRDCNGYTGLDGEFIFKKLVEIAKREYGVYIY